MTTRQQTIIVIASIIFALAAITAARFFTTSTSTPTLTVASGCCGGTATAKSPMNSADPLGAVVAEVREYPGEEVETVATQAGPVELQGSEEAVEAATRLLTPSR